MLNNSSTAKAYPNVTISNSFSFPFTIICSFLGIFILIGNGMVCYIYIVTPSLRTIANKLMMSCSVSAIFVALLFVPFYLVFDDMTKSVSTDIMPISSFLSSFLGFSTLFNIGALTVERYVSIFYALRYELVMTKQKVKYMLCFVWIFPFVLSLLPFVVALSLHNKEEIYRAFKIYQGFLSALLLLTMTVIFMIYIRFWIASRSHLTFEKQQREAMALRRASMYDPGLNSGAVSGNSSGIDEEQVQILNGGIENDIAKRNPSTSRIPKCMQGFLFSNACKRFVSQRSRKNRKRRSAFRTSGRKSPSYIKPSTGNDSGQEMAVGKNTRKKSTKRKNGWVNSTFMSFGNKNSDNNHKSKSNCDGDNDGDDDILTSGNVTNDNSNSISPFSDYTPGDQSPGCFSMDTIMQYETVKRNSAVSEEFTRDLTRRLSTLSDNIKAAAAADERKRKVSKLSITINEEAADESIFVTKPAVPYKARRSSVQSPRKLSVDWTPRKNVPRRKFSVPASLYMQKENIPVPSGCVSSSGVVTNTSGTAVKKNGRRHSVGHAVVRKFSVTNFSTIPSVDMEETTPISESLIQESLHEGVISEEKSESEISFQSCISKFSEMGQSSFSAGATPLDTPLLQRSSTTQSRVLFSMDATPPTTSSPGSRKLTGEIKGIMRNPLENAKKSKNKIKRARTESNDNKGSYEKTDLHKSVSLPLDTSSTTKSCTIPTESGSNSCSPDSIKLHEKRSNSSASIQELHAEKKKKKIFRQDSIETASVKRARYRHLKDCSFAKSKDEPTITENPCSTGDFRAKRRFFSSSASSSTSFNASRSIERRSTASSSLNKRRASIPVSLSSRYSRSRNSYASIVFYAKEFLLEIKHTRVIAYIFLINTLCWVPLIFLNLADAIGQRNFITYPLVLISQFMFLLNSLLMPFVYAFCKQDFKMALKRRIRTIFHNH